jgi:two-component system phosphate regulon sensor histidine kinase PhoR
VEKKPVELHASVDVLISGLAAASRAKKIFVSNRIPAGLSVAADRDKLEQIMINLLDNAFKFTPEGGAVDIMAEELPGNVKILVKDSGIGIPESHQPRIFERFYRVDKARSREIGGTGLGLSIVKHIVELHGGSVGVKSAEGLGSTFWFTLPG